MHDGCHAGRPPGLSCVGTVGDVIRGSALRGYLLEETLAWLLRSTAYDLLVSANQDPAELVAEGNELRVRGRGTTHQVDVLGEFAFTPAFSLPMRLFLEAKYYATPCRLQVVRNALGVIDDVNQNYMTDSVNSRPRRRFQYCYALFSTSGFSDDAQDFALAHQISLIDLSGESFEWLRTAVSCAASKLREAAMRYSVNNFPVAWTRTRLRLLLGTAPADLLPEVSTNAHAFQSSAETILETFAEALQAHADVELLLGFPAAPFIVPLATRDKHSFMQYASAHLSHRVRLDRSGQADRAEWTVIGYEDPDAYQLALTLPRQLEDWISENEEKQRRRTWTVKNDFLSAIMVYYADGGVRACQLTCEPNQFRRC